MAGQLIGETIIKYKLCKASCTGTSREIGFPFLPLVGKFNVILPFVHLISLTITIPTVDYRNKALV